jgi:ATP-dependent RNA helicase DDX19/DBP5
MSSDAPAADTSAPSLASRITRADPTDAPAAESSAPAPIEDADQADGAPEAQGGSRLEEPEFDVEVKLHDMQEDPKNPLFSIKSFEELGL